MYRATPEGKILVANQTLVRMLGYQSEAELVASSFAQDTFVPAEERQTWREKLKRYGFLRNYELTLERKDGTKLYVLDNVHVTRDKRGKTLYYEGTLTDITELKQRKRELEAIVNVSSALRSAQTRNEMLPVILDQATKLLNATDSLNLAGGPCQRRAGMRIRLGTGGKNDRGTYVARHRCRCQDRFHRCTLLEYRVGARPPIKNAGAAKGIVPFRGRRAIGRI